MSISSYAAFYLLLIEAFFYSGVATARPIQLRGHHRRIPTKKPSLKCNTYRPSLWPEGNDLFSFFVNRLGTFGPFCGAPIALGEEVIIRDNTDWHHATGASQQVL
jgi:hypothetical protein